MKETLKSYINMYNSEALFDYEKLTKYLKENNISESTIHQLILVIECSNLKGTLKRVSKEISAVEVNNMVVVCFQTSGLNAESIRTMLFNVLEALDLEFASAKFYLPNDNSNGAKDESVLKIVTSVIMPPDMIKQELAEAEELLKYDSERALALFLDLSKCGSALAMFQVALAYAQGCGTEKNDEKALNWFKAAAANGEPRANYYLGNYYYEHPHLLSNYELAYKYYTSPGSYFVHKDAKKKVVNILNQKKINIIVLSLSGVLLLLMWVFLFVVNVSVHHTSNILGLGIPMTILSTIIYALSWGYYKMTVYNNVKWFSVLMLLFWSIYPLVLAIN